MPPRHVARAIRACALITTVTILAGCAAEVAQSLPPSVAASAPATTAAGSGAPTGATEPLEFGQLTAGTRYVLEGPPTVSFVAGEDLTAFPSPGGVSMIVGDTTLRIATGVDEVYVEEGSQEPIGADVDSILDAFERNDRTFVEDSGSMELGGTEVAYADITVRFFENIEGGAPIFGIDSAPLFLNDRTINRVMMAGAGEEMTVVVVSGPESAGIDPAMAAVAEILGSLELGG